MKRTHHRLSIINALIGAVIMLPFGILTGSAISIAAWMSGGFLIGALLGFLADLFFNTLIKNERLRARRLLILVSLEALLIIYLIIPGYGAYQVVHPLRLPAEASPSDVGIVYENITLMTTDGVELAGWYVPSQNKAAVIAVHTLQGNRTNTIYHLQALANHGYGVLAFDLRGHGESSDERFAAGWNSDQDVLAALAFLKAQDEIDPERIGALGLSVGANVIIYAGADHDDIKALWADGTGAGRLEDLLGPLPPEFRPLWFMSAVYWMYDRMLEVLSGVRARPPIKEEVRRIAPRPIQFVSAGQGWEQFQARKYQANAGEGALLWELPQDTHVGGITAHPEEYVQRLNAFFDEALLSD